MGLICCDSFTTDGSGNATVTTPQWEPQLVMAKPSSATGNWDTYDMMRGAVTGVNDAVLSPNLSAAEVSTSDHIAFTALGFDVTGYQASTTYIYMCVRRPMRTPESASEVFKAIARTGTGAEATVTGVGFATDMYYSQVRSGAFGSQGLVDRLRGHKAILKFRSLAAEDTTYSDTVLSLDMDGVTVGADASTADFNYNTQPYINYFFKRASGFFDVVCFTGTGATSRSISHNLGVVPELVISKSRSAVCAWYTQTTTTMNMQLDNASSDAGNGDDYLFGSWSDSSISLNVLDADFVNKTSVTYIVYLFATLAGISKVGSFSHTNGTPTDVDCGFSAGAKMVIAKRTDSTGSWYLWDSVRGIIAGDDPYLLLNTTDAEVTNTDYIDPLAAGFTITADFITGDYIFYAVA